MSSKKSSRGSSKRNSRASSLHAEAQPSREAGQEGLQSSYDDYDEILPGPRGRTQLRQYNSMEAMFHNSPAANVEAIDDYPPSSRRSRATSPTFSADPIPATKTASDDETGGPSIMFADQTHPRHNSDNRQLKFDMNTSTIPGQPSRSIYAKSQSPTRSMTTTMSTNSVPISFNNLPCRAQHLILNELISQNSEDAAVVFTTLPAPAEGTWKSESDSMSYITDLEVLTEGLGPVLMVHRNSITVTTNL